MLLSPYTMGSLTPLIQTPTNCIDISIVNDAERIHILYIVRGMFRTQVVYQYKQTTVISAPRVLWEDANCDNCLIYMEQGKVVLMWTVNNQPMRCTSENNGATFGIAERFTAGFPTQCFKGELVGADDLLLNAAETYGDSNKGFLPSLFPLDTPPVQDTVKPVSQEPEHPRVYSSLIQNHQQQVNELTALLAQRSDEISTVNARWKTQLSNLEGELQRLKEENQQLKRAPISIPSEKTD